MFISILKLNSNFRNKQELLAEVEHWQNVWTFKRNRIMVRSHSPSALLARPSSSCSQERLPPALLRLHSTVAVRLLVARPSEAVQGEELQWAVDLIFTKIHTINATPSRYSMVEARQLASKTRAFLGDIDGLGQGCATALLRLHSPVSFSLLVARSWPGRGGCWSKGEMSGPNDRGCSQTQASLVAVWVVAWSTLSGRGSPSWTPATFFCSPFAF